MRRAVLAVLLLAAACRKDPRVRPGDMVLIHYELSVGGAAIESTFKGEPVRVKQGAGDVPPGVDEALPGMSPGEEKRLELPPAKAFGEVIKERVESAALADLGDVGRGLKAGQKVMGFRDGRPESARVLSVSGGRAELDFNHPLAGKTVGYRVQVVSVER